MSRKSQIAILMCAIVLGCVTNRESESGGIDAKVPKHRPMRIPSVVEDPIPVAAKPSAFFEKKHVALPSYWQSRLEKLPQPFKVRAVTYRQRVSRHSTEGDRQILITVRSKGSTEDKEKLRTHFELPKPESLNMGFVEYKDRAWRFIQSDDELTLEWIKKPNQKVDPTQRCARPHHLNPPAQLPTFAANYFSKMSTKRNLEVLTGWTPESQETSITVWYKNGFAQDEHIGQIQTALNTQGWRRTRGQSVKQAWTDGDQRTVQWYPIRESFSMGCKLKGPVVHFIWSTAQ